MNIQLYQPQQWAITTKLTLEAAEVKCFKMTSAAGRATLKYRVAASALVTVELYEDTTGNAQANLGALDVSGRGAVTPIAMTTLSIVPDPLVGTKLESFDLSSTLHRDWSPAWRLKAGLLYMISITAAAGAGATANVEFLIEGE